MKSLILGLVVFFALIDCSQAQMTALSKAPVVSVDPEIKGLVWHRWETPSFVVNSIDASQGEYLAQNIDSMKAWALQRWGLPDIKFSRECRVFCVPNKELLLKLFKLSTPRVELTRTTKDKKEISTVWLVLDDSPETTVLPYVSLVSLYEFNLTSGKLPFWFIRGASYLNRTPDSLRRAFYEMPKFTDYSATLLLMKEPEYKALSQDKRIEFDVQAAVFCLFLRKEFGQSNLLSVLQYLGDKSVSETVKKGFLTYYGFEPITTFRAYQKDLHNDIATSVTPDAYLIIKPKAN